MKRFLDSYFRRRELRPIVGGLPHLLKHRYGRRKFYKSGQVRTTFDLSKLKPDLLPITAAALCNQDEFLKACPDLNEHDRQVLRQELIDLFKLEERDLNGLGLLSAFPKPIGLRGYRDSSPFDQYGGYGVGTGEGVAGDGGSE